MYLTVNVQVYLAENRLYLAVNRHLDMADNKLLWLEYDRQIYATRGPTIVPGKHYTAGNLLYLADTRQ